MSTPTRFPIVGIGASAGGVEALQGFFRGMPEQPGVAFVIVTHLGPARESLLNEIVARYTNLPVHLAADGKLVEKDNVYVLPSDVMLGIEGGHLRLHPQHTERRERKPIDLFLARSPRIRANCQCAWCYQVATRTARSVCGPSRSAAA